MGSIISITSNRGGVGKTTTTLNIGVSLALQGHKVLLIDADPLSGLAMAGNLTGHPDQGIVQVLKQRIPLEKAIFAAKRIPLSMMHLGVLKPQDIQFLENKVRKGVVGRLIRQAAEDFEYILIDTPEGHGRFTSILLGYSNSCLMVMPCKSVAVKTLPLFLKQLLRIRTILNPNLRFLGIIITMFDSLNPLQAEIMTQTHLLFPEQTFFSTIIPLSRSFENADMEGVPLCLYKRSKDIGDAYTRLAMELKMRDGQKQPTEKYEQPEKLF